MSTSYYVDFEAVVSGNGSFVTPFNWDGWIYHMRYGNGDAFGLNYYIFGGTKELYSGTPVYDIYINLETEKIGRLFEVNLINYDSTPWKIIHGDVSNEQELNFHLGMEGFGSPPKQLNFYGGIIQGATDLCHLNFYAANTPYPTSIKFNNTYIHQSENT